MSRALRSTLLAPLILLPSLAEPRQAAPSDLCGACKTTGRLPNPWFESRNGAEAGSRCCSQFFEGDKAARGAAFLPCPRCKRPDLKAAAEKELAAIRAERDAWLAERDAVAESIDTKLLWVESDHFVVGFEPARYRTRDKRELDGHAAAHLFARRLEGLYADFQKLFGIDDARMRNKRHHVLIFERLRNLSKASEVLLSMSTDTAAKLAGDPSILVTWLDRASLPDDVAFDRHVTHHVTHLLVSVFHLKEWLYSQGFLDEGIAHFFEMRHFLAVDNSCNQEEREEDFGGVKWPREVLEAVQAGRTPSLAELCAKRTDELRGSDHFFAWSVADWLIASGTPKLVDLIVKLKEKVELREALRTVYGKSFFELENDWKEHVRQTYPARAKPTPAGASVVLPADELRGFPDRPPTSSAADRR
jgi:hypothetical protein